MSFRSKSPKIKVSLINSQSRLSRPQQNMQISSHIQWIDSNQSKQIKSTPIRKKIFDNDILIPSIPTFGNVNIQNVKSQYYQNSHPPQIEKQSECQYRFIIRSKNNQQQSLNYSNTQKSKAQKNNKNPIQQIVIKKYPQLEKRVNTIENQLKQINTKFQVSQVVGDKWKYQIKQLIQQRDIQLEKKKQDEIIKKYNINGNIENNRLQHTEGYSLDFICLEEARSKRIQDLTRQNDRLLQQLNSINGTRDISRYHGQRSCSPKDKYDYSHLYTNQQKFKMKLNSISALPRIKDDDDSFDGNALGELLSPLQVNPNEFP